MKQAIPQLFFVNVFIILLSLDPYYFLFKEFFPTFQAKYWLLCWILRYLISIIIMVTFIRLFLWLLLVMNALMCVLYKETVAKFLKVRMNKLSTDRLLKIYRSTEVLSGSAERFMNPLTAVAVSMLLILGVSSIFSTIALRPPLIPMPIYLVCPMMTVGTFFLFSVILTPACQIYEDVQYFLKEMRRRPLKLRRYEGRLLSKQVQSLRIISINAGFVDYRFFPLKGSTKGTFIHEMLSLAIDLLLSPLGDFSKLVSTKT